MAITSNYIKDTPFEDFDPNDMRKGNEVWGLYDGDRFRTFGTRGTCLNAFYNARLAKLYWMQPDGTWLEVAVKPYSYSKDKLCDWCDSVVEGWGGAWVWEKDGGAIPSGHDNLKLAYLCSGCKRING